MVRLYEFQIDLQNPEFNISFIFFSFFQIVTIVTIELLRNQFKKFFYLIEVQGMHALLIHHLNYIHLNLKIFYDINKLR